MLATVVGVPLGACSGQAFGWRGPFWALAVLALIALVVVARVIPRDTPDQATVSVRAEFAALGSGRLSLALAIWAAVTVVASTQSWAAGSLAPSRGSPRWLTGLSANPLGVLILADVTGGCPTPRRTPDRALRSG